MNQPRNGTNRYRVALVITRSLEEADNAGRIKTLRQICGVLDTEFATTKYRLHNLLETRRIRDLVGALARALLALLRCRPLPIQSILYSAGSEIRRLARELREGNFDAVYLDSVRSQILFRALRRHGPERRVIVDFDDLMSRRMELLAQSGHTPSLGYLRESFPAPLRRLIETPLSHLLCRYESAALRHAEFEMSCAAQAVVLVSAKERDLLRKNLPPEAAAGIHAIPPPATVVCRPEPAEAYRFIFIGSDRLLQNQLSIDFLVATWRSLRPQASLHVYGRQERPTIETPNIFWHGYVQDLAEVYTSDSVLLLPALLPGGIKTKAIEAWSYGRPVLGNPDAFEGLVIDDYPLAVPLQAWSSYLTNPAVHRAAFVAAAHLGNAFVRDALSTSRYATSWTRLFTATSAQVPASKGAEFAAPDSRCHR